MVHGKQLKFDVRVKKFELSKFFENIIKIYAAVAECAKLAFQNMEQAVTLKTLSTTVLHVINIPLLFYCSCCTDGYSQMLQG